MSDIMQKLMNKSYEKRIEALRDMRRVLLEAGSAFGFIIQDEAKRDHVLKLVTEVIEIADKNIEEFKGLCHKDFDNNKGERILDIINELQNNVCKH